MGEFKPVRTLADVSKLDAHEIQLGYFDGLHGMPAPDQSKSASYHHGWRNGAVDAGRMRISDDQQHLSYELVQWHRDVFPSGRVH